MFDISQLLNKDSFTNNISKYVDLNDYVIKNGYLFNKYTNQLIDQYAIADINTDKNLMCLKQMIYLNENGTQSYGDFIYSKEINNTILQDNTNKEKYFFFDNSSFKNIHIYNTKEKKIIKIALKEHFTYPADKSFSFFLGQNDDYLYIVTHSYNGAYLGFYVTFLKLDKKTMKIKKIHQSGGTSELHYYESPYIKKGRNDSEIIIYYILNNTFHLEGLDLIEEKVTIRKQISLSGITTQRNFYSIMSISNENDIYFVKKKTDKFNSDCVFYKVTANTYNLEKLNFDESSILPLKTNNGGKYSLRIFYIERNSKKYLLFAPTLSIYEKAFTDDLNRKEEVDGINLYLFEIKGNNLTLIDKYSANGISYTNLLYREDIDMLIWSNYKNIHFIKLNEYMRFEKIYHHQGFFDAIGISNENDILVQNIDTSIDRLDRGADVIIKYDFEKKVYVYSGNPINSFIDIGVYNIYGNYLEKNIKVELTGNITFDDGSKTKILKTSKTGKTRIPIIVKTNTTFDCYVTIEE